jgi:hypothetical protein
LGAVAPKTKKQVANIRNDRIDSFSLLYRKRLVAFAVEACTHEVKVLTHDIMKVLWKHEHKVAHILIFDN